MNEIVSVVNPEKLKKLGRIIKNIHILFGYKNACKYSIDFRQEESALCIDVKHDREPGFCREVIITDEKNFDETLSSIIPKDFDGCIEDSERLPDDFDFDAICPPDYDGEGVIEIVDTEVAFDEIMKDIDRCDHHKEDEQNLHMLVYLDDFYLTMDCDGKERLPDEEA